MAKQSSQPTPTSSSASRREQRRQRETQRQRQRYLAYGVVAVGVVLLIALIVLARRPKPIDLKNVSTSQPPGADGLAWGGPADAAVVIKEFSDFQCPFCARHALNTMPDLIARYGNNPNVRYEYVPYAFIGAESTQAASAALCAADQSKFWPYHDTVFANQNGENLGTFNDDNLRKIAEAVGLDMGKFNECFRSGQKRVDINTHLREGQDLGVTSTPIFFVNGQRIEGAQPVSAFSQAIDTALQQAGAQ